MNDFVSSFFYWVSQICEFVIWYVNLFGFTYFQHNWHDLLCWHDSMAIAMVPQFFKFHNLMSVKQEMVNIRCWCPLPFRPCITMIHDWVHLSWVHIMPSICSRKLQSVRTSLLSSLEAAVLANYCVIIHSGWAKCSKLLLKQLKQLNQNISMLYEFVCDAA